MRNCSRHPSYGLVVPPPGKAKPSLSAAGYHAVTGCGTRQDRNGFREIVVGRRIDDALVSEVFVL